MDETEAPAPMFLEADQTLVFIDIETFGLDVETDPPIEIGFVVTDLDLKVLHKRSWLIWEDYYDLRYTELAQQAEADGGPAKIVMDMHTESGLWWEAQHDGIERAMVEAEVKAWFAEIGLPPGCNIVGSSVHFDYYNSYFNLNEVQQYFHHRIFDISALKLLFEKYAPKMAKLLKDTIKPKKRHRVLDDIQDTMDEFTFYLGVISIDGKKIWE